MEDSNDKTVLPTGYMEDEVPVMEYSSRDPGLYDRRKRGKRLDNKQSLSTYDPDELERDPFRMMNMGP